MFENEIVTLQNIIKDRTIGSAESIAIKHILESNIPSNVKGFFKAEVEWLLHSERQKEIRSPRFDYNQEDIRILQDQMDRMLIYHFTFSQKDFVGTANRCAHFLFNYLCRPQWTLENYLFEEKDTITLHELSMKFRYCIDYQYYWNIMEKYLQSKNRTEIPKDEAVHLFRKIDGEIIKDHSAVELGKMTLPFFEFISFIHRNGSTPMTQGLPTKALIYFFKDKHIKTVYEHMMRLHDSGTVTIQYDQLIQILKDSFVKKGFSIEEEIQKREQEPEITTTLSGIKFTERDKQQIVKLLFGNEETRFRSVINNIISSTSWDDAALALDHYFTMNDIDAFSREAIILTNTLQTYFSNQQSKDELF